LPQTPANGLMTRIVDLFRPSPARETTPLSVGQRVQLTLAHACNLQILDPPSKMDAHRRYLAIRGQQDAADYVQEVEDRIRARRRSLPAV
jgi:hypothetical protein